MRPIKVARCASWGRLCVGSSNIFIVDFQSSGNGLAGGSKCCGLPRKVWSTPGFQATAHSLILARSSKRRRDRRHDMRIREITAGLQFPEGAIAMDDGSVVLVEIARGTLSRVTPDGKISVIADMGGGP